MRYYATAVYYCSNRFWRFVGQGTASKCSFVLPIDGEKVVGSCDNPVFVTYRKRTTKLLSQHFCLVLLHNAYYCYATVVSLASPAAELSLGYFT